jgi:multicomponent Na+:H+ antiporter subunit E
MAPLRWLLLISALYLALTTDFSPGNILVGVLLAFGLTWLVHPGRERINWRSFPRRAWYFARYVLVLVQDIILSGVGVARVVLTPSLPINPGIIAIPTNCKNDLAQALSAHALTVTPGEMVVAIGEDGTMYTHCLDATHGQEVILEAQRLRRELLAKIVE